MIDNEIRAIIDKYLFKPNTTETIQNIKSEIKSYLDGLLSDSVESYGQIDVRMRDKDTIFLEIKPEIKYKPKIIKYIYLGETIIKNDFQLINGEIYNINCDRFSLEPYELIFKNGYKLPQRQSGNRGAEFFKKMFEDKYFIELSKYRDDRIGEILE